MIQLFQFGSFEIDNDRDWWDVLWCNMLTSHLNHVDPKRHYKNLKGTIGSWNRLWPFFISVCFYIIVHMFAKWCLHAAMSMVTVWRQGMFASFQCITIFIILGEELRFLHRIYTWISVSVLTNAPSNYIMHIRISHR